MSSGTLLTIGALAEKTGCSVPTIRYYEEIALIPPALRKASGHRVYGEAAIEHLTFIRHCREFGFSIDDIKALTSLASNADKDCSEMREIASAHLQSVRTRLTELRALETSLASYVAACGDTCASGAAPQCTLLKDLLIASTVDDPADTPSSAKKCCG